MKLLRNGRLVLTIALVFSGKSRADVIRYQWNAVPNAAYYSGKVKAGAEMVPFRTNDNWLLLEEGSVVSIEAIDNHGAPIMPVEVQGVSPALPPTTPSPPPPPVPETPPPAPETPAPETPAPETPAPETPAPEQAPEEPEAQPEPESEGRATSTVTGNSAGRASLHLGIGKEWLTAQGGISDYKGAANIGGTILRGQWAPADSAWYGDATIAAHDFSTETTEQSSTGGQVGHTESKLLRLAARAGGFYDFAAPPGQGAMWSHLALGAGLAYARLPMLIVSDHSTGTASLTDESALALFVGATLEHEFESHDACGLELTDEPLSFGATKITAMESYVYWRYSFANPLYLELGLDGARTTATHSAGCPAVAGCSATSSTTSNLLQARMGLGANF